ncbi:MAG TPA: hypothetical protein VHO70_02940 [Chitinispirillaceae bacterium]|nr:hypothetical protein [Chitinispirillaceae bacterium]
MVTYRSLFCIVWFLSVILVQSTYSSNFSEPAFEEEPAGNILNKRVGNYKVSIDTIKWQSDTGANHSFLPVTVENSFARGTLLVWIDDKSVIYIIKYNSISYKITGFTDPHALYCNPQSTCVYFVSMDHAYRFNISSQKCEVIFSASGIGSGGAKILGNAKYVVISCRQDTLNVIYTIDIKNMTSRLCFQTSAPVSNLEINDIGLFFFSAGHLHRYLLK